MSNFEMTFKCEGRRDVTPKRSRRGKDIFQLRAIFNKWTRYSIDGPEYFEIEYWEAKNGVHEHYRHIGSEVRARYPNEVKEWETKHLKSWERVYAVSRNTYDLDKKDSQKIPKRRKTNHPNEGESQIYIGNERGLVTANTIEDPFLMSTTDSKLPSMGPVTQSYKSMPPPPVPVNRSSRTMPPPPQGTSTRSHTDMSIPPLPISWVTAPKSYSLASKLLPSGNYNLEVHDDEIEDPDQLDFRFDRVKLNSGRRYIKPSILYPQIIKLSIADLEMTKWLSTVLHPQMIKLAIRDLHSDEEMVIDSHSSPGDISEPLNPFEEHDMADKMADEEEQIQTYQESMGSHVDAIYLNTESELMCVVMDSEDSDVPAVEAIPAIPEQLDSNSDDGTPVSSPGKIFYDYSAKIIQAHSEGLYPLILAALELKGFPCDKWVSKRTEDSIDAYIDFLNTLTVMLAGIDKRILKGLVEGNLPRIARQPENYELSSKLRNMKMVLVGETKATHRPYIYIQYLVDHNGISPNPKDVTKIMDYVETYLRGFNVNHDEDSINCALKIDTVFHTTKHGYNPVKNGYRRYASKDTNPRSHTWKKTILRWVGATRDRLRHSDQNEPLSRPLVEVGYATALSRLDEHKNHTASNYIMNLIEAICKAYFDGKWTIKQFVLFKIAHHTHAMLGEILCTRLSQAYTIHGGGFCHHAAGISFDAVNRIDDSYWRTVQKELLNEKHGFVDNYNEAIRQVDEIAEASGRLIQERKDRDKWIEEARAIRDMNIDWSHNYGIDDETWEALEAEIIGRGENLLALMKDKKRKEAQEIQNFLDATEPMAAFIEWISNLSDEEDEEDEVKEENDRMDGD